jgi:hypothetical protein
VVQRARKRREKGLIEKGGGRNGQEKFDISSRQHCKKQAMPVGLKRALSGGRADSYEYWHARNAGDTRNAPQWNAEGALLARELLDCMRREGAEEKSLETQVFNVLFYSNEWEAMRAAVPKHAAKDTVELFERIFAHHARSLASTRARSAVHKDAKVISRRLLERLREQARRRVTITPIDLPEVAWEVPTFHGWLAADPTAERLRDVNNNPRITREVNSWDVSWLEAPAAFAFERAYQRIRDERGGKADCAFLRGVLKQTSLPTALASDGDHYLLITPAGEQPGCIEREPCDECAHGYRDAACDNDPPTCEAWYCSRGGPPCYGGSRECCSCNDE